MAAEDMKSYDNVQKAEDYITELLGKVAEAHADEVERETRGHE